MTGPAFEIEMGAILGHISEHVSKRQYLTALAWTNELAKRIIDLLVTEAAR